VRLGAAVVGGDVDFENLAKGEESLVEGGLGYRVIEPACGWDSLANVKRRRRKRGRNTDVDGAFKT